MIGDIRDNDNKRGSIIHGLNMHTHALKKGYKSKANALCPILLNYAKEWKASSPNDFIEKAEMCLDHEQKWSVKGVKIEGSYANQTLKTLFYYSDENSYRQLQDIFDSNPTDRRSPSARMIESIGVESWLNWNKHLKQLEDQLLPLEKVSDPLSLPKLKINKL
jgi:hypothetical protein